VSWLALLPFTLSYWLAFNPPRLAMLMPDKRHHRHARVSNLCTQFRQFASKVSKGGNVRSMRMAVSGDAMLTRSRKTISRMQLLDWLRR